jgi:amino acid permease
VEESAGKGGRHFVSSDFVITTRKYELADAAERLVGRHFKTAYMLLLCLFLYGVLWAYSSVFGTSFAGQIPSPFHGGHVCDGSESCDGPIRFWVLIFGLIAVPLSCMDLQEQVVVQVFMSAGLLVAVFMLLLLSVTWQSCLRTLQRAWWSC